MLLIGIENLMFLLFPARLPVGTTADLQVMGRFMLLFLAKMTCMAIASALAALTGALAYYLTGGSWPATIGTAWVVLIAFAAGLVPLIALAFRRFDVARDVAA